MSFWQWLRRQEKRNDPIGDLARDAVADKTFPRRASRHQTIKRYLESCHPCGGVLEAFDSAFRAWHRARLR